ncbi:MAG: aspartate aminotransferase family protein [Gammaproteobacteria bacterium]|nr:aspartate aminotransferase family protein [Gammaproteobacteria bacterium]
MTTADLLARRERLLGAGAALFYKDPINIVRGEGVWLSDPDGRRYLDMYNNVPCVGHAHPHVVEAMHRQAATLNVHSRYLHAGILDYAERLMDLHADPLTSVVFTCTGTEANEVAMRMARTATGGRGIICTNAGYHGNSAEVGKLTRAGQPGRETSSDIRSIPFPQRYRPLEEGTSEADLTELYLAEVRAAIEDFARNDVPFAGMLVCPILANEGLPDIPAGFMTRAAEIVRDAGGLFIADEVQAGFCRTGQWWGYEVTDFVPDIVTMGKPMGNGLPLAACAASSELVDTFRKQTRYFNTFASSPLQAAVGMAVLDVIEKEELQQNAATVGGYLRGELEKLQQGCEPMGDVRGHGLFIGLEWVSDRSDKTPDREAAVTVVNHLKDKGFLISNAGALGNVLKIRPPLVFQQDHADLFLTALQETLHELHGQG